MSIDDLEEAINEVSDDDRSWWPFLWMRPEPHVRLSLARLAALAVLYGLPIGVLAAIAIVALEPVSQSEAPVAAAGFPTMLFLFGSVFIAPMWNRRASRLSEARRARDSQE
ncbi:MAG: hypothetical protein JST00_45470 [Deltaproteobacteria bacterium]|nr:hypothetical protein [Deltaproteobacteria bacterium]